MSDPEVTRVPVAVADHDAGFRAALKDALRAAGFEADDPALPVAWACGAPGRALVITVGSAGDWRSAARAAAAGARVICLLSRPAPLLYVRAYRSGAAGARARGGAVDDIADFVTQALEGDIVVPLAALQLLAGGAGPGHDADGLGATDRAVLQDLVNGATTAQMAASRGVSERTLYRRLGRLYERLQVRGRHEAVQLAVVLGLVPTTVGLLVDVTEDVVVSRS